MSSSASFDFTQFVPGFDFLKKLSQSNASLPKAHQWVAPTVDPQEIEKRIQELKTVHFWLEQNTKAVLATVQALEVQLMTINTLKGMNMSMAQMAQGLHIPSKRDGNGDAQKTQNPASQKKNYFSQPAASEPTQEKASALKEGIAAGPSAQDALSVGEVKQAVDPMAWWGALSQQFSQIANQTFADIQKNAAQVAKATNEAKAQIKTNSKAVSKTSATSKAPQKTSKTARKPSKASLQSPPSTKGAVQAVSAKARSKKGSAQKPLRVKDTKSLPVQAKTKTQVKLKAQDQAGIDATSSSKTQPNLHANLTNSAQSWFSSPPPLTSSKSLKTGSRLSTKSVQSTGRKKKAP